VGATAASTVIFQVSNSTLATSNGAMAGRTIALTRFLHGLAVEVRARPGQFPHDIDCW
jgi:hypothetical protein